MQVVEVASFNMHDSVSKTNESMIGKYAVSDLHTGDYILNTKIPTEPLENYDYHNNFNGTDRAVSVSIKSFAAGFSGKLEPGDIVSVWVSDYGELKETISPIELRYVQVLAVAAGSGLNTNENEENNEAIEEDKELPWTLTFKVSSELVKLLAELEVKGKNTLYLFIVIIRKILISFLKNRQNYWSKNKMSQLITIWTDTMMIKNQ